MLDTATWYVQRKAQPWVSRRICRCRVAVRLAEGRGTFAKRLGGNLRFDDLQNQDHPDFRLLTTLSA